MRGYGQSDAPPGIDQYTLFHLVGDVVGLLEALKEDSAVIVGHDWGAPVAWPAALFRPDLFRAVVGLSVPFRPRGPVRPTTAMPQSEEAQFYQLYFQTPGVAEKEFERDVRDTFRCLLGALATDKPSTVGMVSRSGGFLTGWVNPSSLPSWLTEADIDFYTSESPALDFVAG